MKNWRVLALLILSLLGMQAQACDPLPHDLGLVFANPQQAGSPVNVQFKIENGVLTAQFAVKSDAVNSKDPLGPGQFAFQFDVVELFVSVDGNSGNLPYYEIDLSAADQIFQKKIVNPKHITAIQDELNIVHPVVPSEGGWMGTIQVPLSFLGWKGDPSRVVGNAFAVLGFSPNRAYWSLSLPRQTKVTSFHQPQFFKPLLVCN